MADPRKLQDEALAAVASGDWSSAVAIYLALERARPSDGAWPLKLGECLRRQGRNEEAVGALTRALQAYAKQDLRAKAIAVCKLILEIDPRHRDVREVLDLLSDPTRPLPWASEAGAASAQARLEPPRDFTPNPEFDVPSSLRKAERGRGGNGIQPAVAPAGGTQPFDTKVHPRVVLPRTPFFSALSQEQLRMVNQRAHLVEVEMGEILFAMGDPADALYLVAAGEIAVLTPQEVARLHRGDFFGEEMAVLPNQPRMATVRAVEPSQVLILDRSLVNDIAAGAPALLEVLAASLRERLLAILARSSPLLAPFSESERLALLARFRFLEVDKHNKIHEPGGVGAGLFILLAGEAVASLEGRSLERLQPGDAFGEIGPVTESAPRSTVMAREKCFVLHLPRAEFEAIRTTYPQLVEHLAALAKSRLQQAAERPDAAAGAREPPARNAARAAPRLLLVHGHAGLSAEYARAFTAAGYGVECAGTTEAALDCLARAGFDVVVCNTDPATGGVADLLRGVRGHDLDVPVILTSTEAAPDSALAAVSFGVVASFHEPAPLPILVEAAGRAVQYHRLTRLRREALGRIQASHEWMGDQAGLDLHFGSALRGLWMAFQPIVSASAQGVFAFEAFLRSREHRLPSPAAVLRAAERLHRIHDLGRLTRDSVAASAARVQGELLMFVNLHIEDLLDEHLLDPSSRLAKIAPRVILEISERNSLDELGDLPARVAALRALGFRVAVDNLGAGHAGLATLAQIAPEVAKLDISLVREIDSSVLKQGLVRELLRVCREMDMRVICEGVETEDERDALVELGADLMQGHLFAKPGPPFPDVPRAVLPRKR